MFMSLDRVTIVSTNQLVFKPEDVIEWASKFMTLKVGDMILTGNNSLRINLQHAVVPSLSIVSLRKIEMV